MPSETPNPCPTCGEPMDTDHVVWLWNAKFYCSEDCCRTAATNG